MYRDNKGVIPCITGRGAMCGGICHLYKYSPFPSPNQWLVTILINLLHFLGLIAQENWFGLGRGETIRTRTKTHSWDQRSRSTTPQQQGYWEHWGKLGETGISLLYSSERSQWALSRVQRSELASVLHVSEGEVRGERWEGRLSNKGVSIAFPPVTHRSPSPDLAYHSQKAASMCPYK